MCVVMALSPEWLAAWKAANSARLSSEQRTLEDNPQFVLGKYRYAIRTRVRKNGELDWSLLNHPMDEPLPEGWPDAPTET
jgi:hypothetical protein